MYGKHAIFNGLAQYYQAMVCKNKKAIGEEIARLHVCTQNKFENIIIIISIDYYKLLFSLGSYIIL